MDQKILPLPVSSKRLRSMRYAEPPKVVRTARRSKSFNFLAKVSSVRRPSIRDLRTSLFRESDLLPTNIRVDSAEAISRDTRGIGTTNSDCPE
jgi:hypothetical protein